MGTQERELSIERACELLGVPQGADSETVNAAFERESAGLRVEDLASNPLRHLAEERLESLAKARDLLLANCQPNQPLGWRDLRTGMSPELVRRLLGPAAEALTGEADGSGPWMTWLYGSDADDQEARPQVRFRRPPGGPPVVLNWLAPTDDGLVELAIRDVNAPARARSSHPLPWQVRFAAVLAALALAWLMVDDSFVVAESKRKTRSVEYGTRGLVVIAAGENEQSESRSYTAIVDQGEERIGRLVNQPSGQDWLSSMRDDDIAKARDLLARVRSLRNRGLGSLLLCLGAMALLLMVALGRIHKRGGALVALAVAGGCQWLAAGLVQAGAESVRELSWRDPSTSLTTAFSVSMTITALAVLVALATSLAPYLAAVHELADGNGEREAEQDSR